MTQPDPGSLRTLTAEEISTRTGIKVQKVRELIKSGYFPKANIPGRIMRVFESDVVNALASSRSKPNEKSVLEQN